MIYFVINLKQNMKWILLLGLMLSTLASEANTTRIFSLSADAWARPRSGQMVPQLDAVRQAINYWETGTNAAIMLSYPGEDSGEIWAAELRDWLVSLGIPSDKIILAPGFQAEDQINILVGSKQELNQ